MTQEQVKAAADLSWGQGPVVKAETPPTWALVSLMGHKTYAGRLTEEEKFGCKLGRLDIPEDDGTFRTVYFGGASVYSVQVVTEAVARTAGRSSNPTPVSPWDFPKQLPASHADALCPNCACNPCACHIVNENDRYADAENDDSELE